MRAILIGASFLLAGPVAAQDGVIGSIDDTVASLAGDGRVIGGIGVGITTQPYAAADNETRFVPIPLISYQSERFEFVGKTLEAQLYETSGLPLNLAFSTVADWRFQSYDADDSPQLTGMDDRDGTLEVGGRVKTDALGVQLSGTVLADALSRHGGYEITGQASFELSSWRPLSVRPNVGVRYQSSNLADYYYGVDPEEAASPIVCTAVVGNDCPDSVLFDRPAYETGDALLPFVGVTARQALSRKVIVVGSVSYEFFPDEIADSPIVEDSGRLFSFVGIAYAFGAPLGSEGSPEDRAAR